jgi:hypothetical protein
MTYTTAEESVSSTVPIPEIGYRKLTESQGARSALYRVLNPGTWDVIGVEPVERAARPARERYQKKDAANIAKREHLGRLLRSCQALTDSLRRSVDPGEMALLGAAICDTLDEMWQHRLAREDDWIEVLNALQIVLRGEIFENMSEAKKNALASIFANALLSRTISRYEVQRAVRTLVDGGFDLWRGLKLETKD